MMLKLLCIFSVLVISVSACVGSPKPQELPAGHYVGSMESSIYNTESVESIVMNYKIDASSPNGSITIYDANQSTEIQPLNIITQGTWSTITNGQNGITHPCFRGIIRTTLNNQIGRGWPVAFVNCWLADDFIPGSHTFQAQYLIWNPISTINYAEFGGSVFLHTPN